MEKFIVMGRTRLEGTVRIGGSKNAVLPIMAASLLTSKNSTIFDVPHLTDVLTMKKVLEHLGARVNFTSEVLEVDTSGVNRHEVAESLTRQMRASNLVMGPLLGRFHRVRVSHPGGCDIGSRPMDLHLKGFQSMGAAIHERYGFIEVEANDLHGAEIHLDFPSVGATENLMMAAVLAKGQTVIRNAAKEPEIVDLQNFLNGLGAKVKGAGLDVIRVEGVTSLNSVEYTIIPDRIEAGTYMTAGAITGGDILITNVIPEHLEPISAKLRETGVTVTEYPDSVRVQCAGRARAVDFKTMPYPGFPTDMQPQVMALMATADGTTVIAETIFDNRFKHVDELRRMGANIKVEGRAAIIKGVPRLSGAFVEATDLRAGAALVLAGLAAEDATIIENIYHIDRGYAQLDGKLNGLGARIMRVNNHR
ncbi:UDP-N-acetylglucosamine 1-carboxyvinyltransferase [Clostridiales bacterium PH28_bin88]|nr:UDP-N-acetylglucosamine 1-carboxyvinyltransferase [Clostridiales bacterium PH28_bin88]